MSSDKSFVELWEEFDTKETDKHDLEKSNLCQKMLSLFEGKKKEEIQLKLNLFGFIFVAHRILENVEDVDIEQLSSYAQSFIQQCDENIFEYYKKRYNERKSILNKSRYSFACWLFKKDPIFIENTISLLIDNSLHSSVKGEPIDTVHLLVIAFNLSMIYNIKKFSNPNS